MKRIITLLLFACCLSLAVVQPVLAANTGSEAGVRAVEPLNVNSASQEELTVLPGIGPVTAERIVAYRTKKGPFKTVDDLILIKGIGQKTLEKIRPLVTI